MKLGSILTGKVNILFLVGCLVAVILTIMPSNVQALDTRIGDQLQVSGSEASLYAAPSDTSSKLLVLTSKHTILQMQRQGGWVLVSVRPSGIQGWVQASELRKAEPVAQEEVGMQVSGKEATLYSAPSETSTKLMVLTSEHKFTQVKSQADWVLVSLKPSGIKGWVRQDAVGKLKAQAVAVAARKAVSEAIKELGTGPVTQVAIADLGFIKGHSFMGSQSAHRQNFFFDVPLDSGIRAGIFRIFYRAGTTLHEKSNLTVYINDVPVKQIKIEADGGIHEALVVLPNTVFHGGMVKVTIGAGTLVDENRCLDLRAGGGFLHMLPESRLELAHGLIRTSVRDAWRMLPQKVVLSLPGGRLEESQFASALSIMELLTMAGKEVVIKRLPELGDIVIGAKEDVVSVLNQRGQRLSPGFVELNTGDVFQAPSDNLSLIRSGDQTSLAITEPYDVQPIYLLENRWKLLAAGRHYGVNKPDRFYSVGTLPDGGKSDFYVLPFTQLDASPHYLSNETVWNTTLSPRDVPAGTRLEMLNLKIVAPVRWEGDPSYELYVFLNDVLVFTKRLENSGLKQSYSVPLPAEYQQQYNNIRFVVQHDVESGNCFGLMPTDFVQVTPDTTVVVKKEEVVPGKFADLARYLASGADTYVDENYLNEPEKVLYLMARITADLPIEMDFSRLRFANVADNLDVQNPFVAFGDFKLEGVEAPVRLDDGPVEIRDAKGQSFFSVSALPKITIAQIAKSASAFGLWVRPSSEILHEFKQKLRMVEGDVAFLDANGVLLTVDSNQPTLAEFYYPKAEDWFELLGKYRFWLLALAWFLLSLLLIYLYNLTTGRRKGHDPEVEMPSAETLHDQRVHHANINVEDDDLSHRSDK